MWSKRKQKNRRAGRTHNVLDVKLRSSQVRAAGRAHGCRRLGVSFATIFGLYLLWRHGDWALEPVRL